LIFVENAKQVKNQLTLLLRRKCPYQKQAVQVGATKKLAGVHQENQEDNKIGGSLIFNVTLYEVSLEFYQNELYRYSTKL
jgi:hypothetical protein